MSIKVGDWVAFQVRKVGVSGRIYAHDSDYINWLDPEFVTKIPPPDPHAELKEAVVEAAESWATLYGNSLSVRDRENKLIKAVAAWMSAQRPPDLVAELLRMNKQILDVRDGALPESMSVLTDDLRWIITALEAERDGRKG